MLKIPKQRKLLFYYNVKILISFSKYRGAYWSFGNRVGNSGKILGLNVKLKNGEGKFLSIMTVKWEEKVCKCDKREVQSSQ